jgi:predicted RNA-binding Zn-ribbon protein involved in translation (DUF1610 family)
MVTCPLCGSEEVYRGLDKRRRFTTWFILLFFGGALPPLGIFAVIAVILIPFTGERVCRNCGLILSREWQAVSSPSPPTAT